MACCAVTRSDAVAMPAPAAGAADRRTVAAGMPPAPVVAPPAAGPRVIRARSDESTAISCASCVRCRATAGDAVKLAEAAVLVLPDMPPLNMSPGRKFAVRDCDKFAEPYPEAGGEPWDVEADARGPPPGGSVDRSDAFRCEAVGPP